MSALSTVNMSRKASEDLWEARKRDIHEIYIKQNKSLAVVRAEILQRFGFSATKAQYELHIQKWNFRKNLTKADWIRICKVIRDRNNSEAGTEVLVHGKIISREKLTKELHRYARSATHEDLLTCVDKLDASGIHIQDPGISSEQLTSHAGVLWRLQDSERMLMVDDMESSTVVTSPVFQTTLTQSQPWNNINPFQPSQFTSPAFDQFEPQDWNDFDVSIGNGSEKIFGHPFATLRLEQSIWSTRHMESLLFQDSFRHAGPHSLTSMLPPQLLPRGLTGSNTKHLINTADTECSKRIAMYMLVNALISPDSEKLAPFLKWIETQSHQKWWQGALSGDHPESQATINNLYRYAVIGENLTILKFLTDTAYDLPMNEPHSWFCHSTNGKKSPIYFALSIQHLELVRFLANSGARLTGFNLPEILRLVEARRLREAVLSGRPVGTIRANTEMIRYLQQSGVQSCICAHNFCCSVCSSSECVFRKNYILSTEQASSATYAFKWGDIELLRVVLEREQLVHCLQKCLLEAMRTALRANNNVTSSQYEMACALIDAGVIIPLGELEVFQDVSILKLALNHGLPFELPKFTFGGETTIKFVYDVLMLYKQHTQTSTEAAGPTKPLDTYLRHRAIRAADRHLTLSAYNYANDPLHTSTQSLKIEYAIIEVVAQLPSRVCSQLLNILLGFAFSSDNEAFASALLEAGADLTEPPLFSSKIACGRNTLRLYLRHVSYPIHCVRHGIIWQLAIDSADTELILMLTKVLDMETFVRHRSEVTRFIMTPFTYALLTGKRNIALTLLKSGTNVNGPGASSFSESFQYFNPGEIVLSSLDAAIQKRDTGLLRRVIQSGANIFDNAALYSAVLEGQEMVETLLAVIDDNAVLANCVPATFGIPALQHAILRRDLSIVRLLLNRGISVCRSVDISNLFQRGLCSDNDRIKEECALETAIRTDMTSGLSILSMVLDAWNKASEMEFPPAAIRVWPLSLAIKHANRAATELLMHTCGTKYPEAARAFAGTYSPLQQAVEVGNIELVQILISHEADVDIISSRTPRSTALQIAAREGLAPIAKLLCEAGANVNANACDCRRKSALVEAAARGHVSMIRQLVQHGAQLCGTGDYQFERAKELAKDNGWDGVISVLESLRREQLLQCDLTLTGSTNEGQNFSEGSDAHAAGRAFEQSGSTIWSNLDDFQRMQGECLVDEMDGPFEGPIIDVGSGFVGSEDFDSIPGVNAY